MFSYSAILKQAWQLTRTHKFLWLFGLLLVLGNLINFAFNWQDSASSTLELAEFVVYSLFLIIYFRAQAGTIIAIKALIEKQATSFSQAWHASKLFYIRLFWVAVFILSALILFGLVLGEPVASLIRQDHLTQAWILGIFAGAIFLPLSVLAFLISSLAPMFVVIFDLSVWESFDRSAALIKQFIYKLLGLGLMLFILQALPVVLFWVLSYYTDGLVIRMAGLMVFSGIEIVLVIFNQTAWILAFLKLIKPQKFQEDEELPEPAV